MGRGLDAGDGDVRQVGRPGGGRAVAQGGGQPRRLPEQLPRRGRLVQLDQHAGEVEQRQAPAPVQAHRFARRAHAGEQEPRRPQVAG